MAKEELTPLMKYLNGRDLWFNFAKYQYSDFDWLHAGETETLFSTEARRLPFEAGRFDFYDGHGEYVLEGATPEEMQHQIELAVQDQPLGRRPHELPNLDITMKLIDQLNHRGYRVAGFNRENRGYDEVVDDVRLRQALKDNVTDDYDHFVRVSAKGDASEKIVNLDYETLMVAVNKREIVEYDYHFERYTIWGPDGQLCYREIPASALGAVALGILAQLDPAVLQQAFLEPQLTRVALADARLFLASDVTSEPWNIKSMSDLKLIENLPVGNGDEPEDEDEEVDPDQLEKPEIITQRFQFTDRTGKYSLGPSFEMEDAAETLDHVFHPVPVENAATQAFSDQIIQLARKVGLLITRSQRRLVEYRTGDDLFVTNGEITRVTFAHTPWTADWSDLPRPMETVFDLRSESSEELVMHDLPLKELLLEVLKRADQAQLLVPFLAQF